MQFFILLGMGPGDMDFPSLGKHLQRISSQELETYASLMLFHAPKPSLLFEDYQIVAHTWTWSSHFFF